MKLSELINLDLEGLGPIVDEAEEDQEQQKPGTYAGVRFSQRTVDAIKQYQEHNEIPNRVPRDKAHTTLLYSRKHLPDYQAAGNYTKPILGQPQQLEIWPARDGSNCLVLRYKCDELVDRHNQLMEEHQATYDFPTFIPHVTFSYDVGDIDISNLPPYKGPIEIIHEYQEELNDVLARNSTC